MKKTCVWLLILVSFLSPCCKGILLITQNGESVEVDQDLYSSSSLITRDDNNAGTFSQCKINPPTVYKETFNRISSLLTYEKHKDSHELELYLMKHCAVWSEYEIADILNTLSFFKFNTLVALVLWYCPINKEREVISLCKSSLCAIIKSFSSFLRIQVPLGNGVERTLEIAANKARHLPFIVETAKFEGYTLSENNSFEVPLPALCIPEGSSLQSYENFFQHFFDLIAYFSLYKTKDIQAFIWDLFYKPELKSAKNVAAFLNLLEFFQHYKLLKVMSNHFSPDRFSLMRKHPLQDLDKEELYKNLSADVHPYIDKNMEKVNKFCINNMTRLSIFFTAGLAATLLVVKGHEKLM